jgi:SAM-dependent methyltransferase
MRKLGSWADRLMPDKRTQLDDATLAAIEAVAYACGVSVRELAPTVHGSRRSGYIDNLVRIQMLHQGGAVLEIGGYPFHCSICLRKLGMDLTTVDLAPQRAQKLIQDHSLRVVACDIECEALPFEDHSVAMVVFCETFEHLRVNPLFALKEMRRVLQKNGLLFLTTPNLYRLGNVVSFALGRGLAFDPIYAYDKLPTIGHMGHVREYTASEMQRFLARAGFATVDIAWRADPSPRGKLVDAVRRLLPRLRNELVITARSEAYPAANAPMLRLIPNRFRVRAWLCP